MKDKKAVRIQQFLERARQQFMAELVHKLGLPHNAEKVTEVLNRKKGSQ